MSVYLVTFQMTDRDRSQSMVQFIKEYGIWARITDTTWCIKATDKTTADIRDNLNAKFVLQSNERLMVVDITNSHWASYYLPKEVTDWLKEK